MAERPQIMPEHRPHEQLRTEAPTQKPHSDKYVSAFVSGESQVDIIAAALSAEGFTVKVLAVGSQGGLAATGLSSSTALSRAVSTGSARSQAIRSLRNRASMGWVSIREQGPEIRSGTPAMGALAGAGAVAAEALGACGQRGGEAVERICRRAHRRSVR